VFATDERIQSPFGAPVWPPYPTSYEINTWVWLTDISQKHGRTVNLSSVPPAEWDDIAAYGFDSVWLMGVWERSPAGIAIANQNKGLLDDFKRALTDFSAEDNVGSPYCVRRYAVDEQLGGPEGLTVALRELSSRGMKLILDFVPNHVAPDHPWIAEHPEYFIRGSTDDARNDPASYIEMGGMVYARGRDPCFPAWPDVLQLNAFGAGLRQAAIQTISTIAQQCDGIRCDMAMLMLNQVFKRTWGGHVESWPATEYWVDVISATKRNYPGFLFVAEAYWDMEWELQQQGFDFCYDKKLYDRLEHGHADSVRAHLGADIAYQNMLLRFIENHDEPRAATNFSPAKQRAVALTVATLPGLKLFHEGQFEGRKVRTPVFLRRRPNEPVDQNLQSFYKTLLNVTDSPVFREGQWDLCDCTGWTDNASFQNLVAWSWLKDDERYVIVVNLSDVTAQGRVQVQWAHAGANKWHLQDALSGAIYERDANEMLSPGLYVELSPWSFHFFHCRLCTR
jgi:hypothetical protein